MSRKIWVAKNGQSLGPYSEEEIRQYVQSNQLDPSDPAAWAGENAWSELGKLVALPKPPPAAPPPAAPLPRPNKKRTRKRVAESLPQLGRTTPKADWVEDGEKQLYKANPSMFRNNPIWFIISIILILAFGLGLVILLIWWLNVKGMTFMVSNERVTLRKGILSKHTNEIFLKDIRNVQIRQSFSQRIFGVATIGISSAGQAGVEIAVDGLRNPNKVKDIIDRHRRG